MYKLFNLWGLLWPVCAALILGAISAQADGLFLPSAPQPPSGQDSVSTTSGLRCQNAIASSGPYLDIGAAQSSGPRGFNTGTTSSFDEPDRVTLYARVVIPLGQRPERLDCARLLEMELRRLQAEIELLTLEFD